MNKTGKLTKKAGIEVTAHCMIGLLGETPETVKQTFRFIKEIDPEFALMAKDFLTWV